MRSVLISNYKKNTEERYHRHRRETLTAAQCERRAAFHEADRVDCLTQPRILESTILSLIGDSLVRDLIRIQAHWQVGILSFSGAAMPQMLASPEMLEVRRIHTVTMMMATNDVSRGEWRKTIRLPEKVSCLLQEVRIYLVPTICRVPYNMMQDKKWMNMN